MTFHLSDLIDAMEVSAEMKVIIFCKGKGVKGWLEDENHTGCGRRASEQRAYEPASRGRTRVMKRRTNTDALVAICGQQFRSPL